MRSLKTRLIRRARELSESCQDRGWDSYDALPISETAFFRCWDLINLLPEEISPEPAIVPAPWGGYQIEWHPLWGDVEVEIDGHGIRDIFVDVSFRGKLSR